ncbi:AP-1 complex subunit mu-1 isoform X1 [Tribolium castaneum]|uniref:AP-1 complex subunit mu-1-like Protein n=1 Tax=Tribolium castaneum TaxID=7070 RepID=A0A139WKG8_TRICA|nr:PREDICTED: AP-1 complex subunit mu-1-like isoform X1 [Tribolium castaneum]KYB28548.1 AP-1 complex subunit mu-1-like Protein [Tribolium castaneum]|eukprot:XP_015833698.1 PREDICTED: AP-1 complex subunit mu-1-like isoform X1 [Tribolium castaneum]
MVLSAIFILDSNGIVLMSRDYRGDVGKEQIEEFLPLLNQQEELGNSSPLLHHDKVSFAYVKHEGLYITSVMKNNANIALVFTFLYKFIQIATQYFNKLEEESIRDNFVILYELLDEIMDFGYPQTTDSKILQTYIFQESYKLKKAPTIPAVVTNVVSWRPEGIKYRRNELFIDVIESVNLSVNSSGAILRNEVSGCVKMKVHLSGMPQLRLGLSDKILLAINSSGQESATFEDVKFHQCVQLSRICDKNVYFIPPDGDFELMSYRMNTEIKPLILVRSKVVQASTSRIEYTVKVSAQFKASSTANNVEVTLPVCQDVDSPVFKATAGMASYVPEKAAVVWKIKYFPGGSENLLHVCFKLSTIRGEEKDDKKPIQVKFMIPYFTISGLQIKYMKVIEKSNYKALTWVRYTTQNGEYLVCLI